MVTNKPKTITPSQTVGPFYAYCLSPVNYKFRMLASNSLVTKDVEGKHITLRGTVLDGDGLPVPDALIEIWQPDGLGRFSGHHPLLKTAEFKGFGRAMCDALGLFSFETVKPGGAPMRDGVIQAPHVAVSIFGKGLNRHLYTRVYFDDEEANKSDPVLNSIPEDLRSKLIAKEIEPDCYEISIRLQGEGESVFFDV